MNQSSTDMGGPSRRLARRGVVIAVVVLQLVAIVAAYGRPHKVFGWQMFNASSDWQAEIVRVTEDGSRVDVRDPWPGGYTWSGLVSGRGLGEPFFRNHADSGLDTTLALFQGALDYVAANTPGDDETLYLEAEVTVWDNGRDPELRLMQSIPRPGAG